jgi:hypothetical protein
MTTELTYETLRDHLVGLEPPKAIGERANLWVIPRVLGIARTFDDFFEIFIVGERVHPRTAIVRQHLEFGRWEVAGTGERFEASRLVLPPEPHFLAVATMIAVELHRSGLGTARALQDVINEVEPIIEMALRRGALDESHQVGLMGELLCLEVMLDAVLQHSDLRVSVLDMWQGHRQGLRDFIIGETAIEVKTTQQEASSHKISGLHQVERTEVDGLVEETLYLLSVGITASEHEGQTVPDVVQRIVNRLADPAAHASGFSALQRRFLSNVACYGSGSSRGYDHTTMAQWQVYSTRFRATFTPRLYDIGDPDVRIIRRRDLAGTYVSPDDIQYRLDLEPNINGVNPVASWKHTITGLVQAVITLPSG